MMSTLHFHYLHAHGCRYDLPCSNALNSDDADRNNRQILMAMGEMKRGCVSVYLVCVWVFVYVVCCRACLSMYITVIYRFSYSFLRVASVPRGWVGEHK